MFDNQGSTVCKLAEPNRKKSLLLRYITYYPKICLQCEEVDSMTQFYVEPGQTDRQTTALYIDDETQLHNYSNILGIITFKAIPPRCRESATPFP